MTTRGDSGLSNCYPTCYLKMVWIKRRSWVLFPEKHAKTRWKMGVGWWFGLGAVTVTVAVLCRPFTFLPSAHPWQWVCLWHTAHTDHMYQREPTGQLGRGRSWRNKDVIWTPRCCIALDCVAIWHRIHNPLLTHLEETGVHRATHSSCSCWGRQNWPSLARPTVGQIWGQRCSQRLTWQM